MRSLKVSKINSIKISGYTIFLYVTVSVKNWPCLHLVVIRETDVSKSLLKLLALACARLLLFSRTVLSNLLNTIQFTFEAAPCLIFNNFSPVLQGGG